MRFLVDMGVSMTTVRDLRSLGHDVAHLRDEGLQTMADADILAKARREARVILTLDLDFGDLLALGAFESPSVVLFRLSDARPSAENPRLRQFLDEAGDRLAKGALVLVQDNRYRVRALPIRAGSGA